MTAPTVDLFIPCYVDQLLPRIGVHTVKLLRAAGWAVRYPADQTCCGQPAWNAGCRAEATLLAERFARVFDGDAPIVVPSGSCAAMVHAYRHLLDADVARHLAERVVELSCFLMAYPDRLPAARFPHRVGMHDGCHAAGELGILAQPRALLGRVEGLELVPLETAGECCGFGGSFSVDFPEVSASMADRKLEGLPVDGNRIDYIVTTEPSCLLHLDGRRRRTGRGVPVLHLSEVLVR